MLKKLSKNALIFDFQRIQTATGIVAIAKNYCACP